MSGIGIQTDHTVKPILPGSAVIAQNSPASQPTHAANSPASSNKPEDAGDLSSITNTVQELLKAKQAEISASAETYKANSDIDAQTTSALTSITNESLATYKNIEIAARLPGGPSGKLAQIVGLFDSDYNINVQKLHIEENQLRAQNITANAEALKAKNNALPVLMGKVTEAQQAAFGAQKDLITLGNQALETRIKGVQLEIDLGRAAREKAMFPIQEAAAEVALHTARTAAAQGDRDAYNNSMIDFVSHLPTDFVKNKLLEAQQTGAPMVDFTVGMDKKTKQPIVQSVPFNLVNEGLIKSSDLETKANTYVAADISQRTQLVPKIQGIMSTAQVMTSLDPRAAQVLQQTGSIASALNPKDPNNVRQVATLIDQQNAQLQQIAKDVSDKFSTKEAKAAVLHYAQPGVGVFDATGGSAVVADSVGTPAFSMNGVYKTPMTTLNTMLAGAIARQGLLGGGTGDPNNATDAQSMIAALMSKPTGRSSLSNLTSQILADPNNQKVLARQMQAVIYTGTVNKVIDHLKHQKDAPQLWNEIDQHPELVMSNLPIKDANGQPVKDKKGNVLTAPSLDYQKLFQTFEKHTVFNGNKVNYAESFLGAVKAYAATADDNTKNDPRYVITDHALEGAIFNGHAASATLGDLYWNLRQQAQLAHQAMAERIRKDITGETQRAVAEQGHSVSGVSTDKPVLFGGFSSDKRINELAQNAPSATDTGLTAEQVKQLFKNGY